MIHSPDNDKLKTIRKLAKRSWRDKLGLFAAEGEDLVEAAAAAGWEPRFVLRAGTDVEPSLLDAVSSLGSGTRVIGVYEQRWAQPGPSTTGPSASACAERMIVPTLPGSSTPRSQTLRAPPGDDERCS